ncbi:hypothetical protein WR25_01519 [Diploscapter pachys]|uniref:STAS domain-containing protein n=1 Tax=Diploscapter pachys TaxID=2018661 RepID=A0A2A2J1W8_9BILA|nr:hypothetical protein WR25_01519 [Diploscapter pachys]
MQRTATSYNGTAYVNHSLAELTSNNESMLFNNETLMQILGNETSFLEEVTMEMWTEGLSPVKEIHVATTIIFLAGVVQVLMGVFRLQYLTSLFSEQVMSGFVVGGGVHVFFAQIGDVLAFLLYGKQCLAPWLDKAFLFPVPFELVLAIVGITATNYAELSRRHNIRVVGNIPTEFPPPSLPRFDLIPYIGLNAVAIAITSVAIHITVAKVVEKRYKYKVNHGQELYALGFVGVLSSFFPVFPVTSGFARSVVGAAVGGSTQAIWIVSLVLTVCYDMREGLLLAIGFAVLTTIIRTQRPKWHFLSRDNETNTFKETRRKELDTVQGNVCIFRFDAPLIFTSIDRFTMTVWQCIKKWERSKVESFITIDQMNAQNNEEIFEKKLKAARRRWKKERKGEERCKLVIDCAGFPYVDYLGLETLKNIYCELSSAGIKTFFVVHKRDLKKLFEATDFYEIVDKSVVFDKVELAVQEAERSDPSIMTPKETLTALASILTQETTFEESEDVDRTLDDISIDSEGLTTTNEKEDETVESANSCNDSTHL